MGSKVSWPREFLPLSPQPAPIQAREVVSDLSAVQTPPQSARIRRVALAPIPLAQDDLVLPLESPIAGQSSRKKAATDEAAAMGEYQWAFVVTEERVTKWPAPRDDVEYDVLRVSVNVHTN